MIPLVSAGQFLSRAPAVAILPVGEEGQPDAARI